MELSVTEYLNSTGLDIIISAPQKSMSTGTSSEKSSAILLSENTQVFTVTDSDGITCNISVYLSEENAHVESSSSSFSGNCSLTLNISELGNGDTVTAEFVTVESGGDNFILIGTLDGNGEKGKP